MHIQQVKIRNIRGFREVDLDFTRPDESLAGWTVLAGRNGSGKSTLLKAMALAQAGPEIARTLQESFGNWIRVGEEEATVNIRVALPKIPDVESLGLVWERLKGREPKLTGGFKWSVRSMEILANAFRDEWFTAAYGPYRRLSGHAADAQRLMTGPSSLARLVSLFREDASLVEGTIWLREMYLRRLEGDPEAAHAEQCVISLLNDGLLPDSVCVEGVDSSGLKVRTPDAELPLLELSDGYRSVAALVVDIVRHLYDYFGPPAIEEVTDDQGTCPKVLYQGVVLIDEVELHLHVSWQKRIGFWLKRHFPNIQFIVTTHSPFVCQAADPRGLIRLPAPGENRPVEHVSEELYYTVVNGSADDAVMTELFGLETPYSEESEKLRDEVAHLEARLQTGTATAAEQKELEELSSQLPQTPTGNIEQLLRKLTADA